MNSGERNDVPVIGNGVDRNKDQDGKESQGSVRRLTSKRITMPVGAIIACTIAISLSVAAIMGIITFVKEANNKTVHILATPLPFGSEPGEPVSSDLPDRTPLETPEAAENSGDKNTEYGLIDSAMSSVVSIDVMEQYGYSSVAKSSGSGVIVSEDGYIVTCSHVIDGASKIYVYLDDGTSSEAKLVGVDNLNDLAVIKIEGSGYPHAEFGDSSTLRVGESVFAIGNALGQLSNTYTRGVISGLDRNLKVNSKEMTLLQTDAAVNHGNSGGGLFRASDGTLIGIVNAKSKGQDIDGLGFAIPSSIAGSIINDLVEYGFVTGRPYLGAETETITLTGYGFFTSRYTYPSIVSIDENGPAEAAGLVVGDVILSINGVSVSDSDMLESAINSFDIGATIELSILRDQDTITISVTLGERAVPTE